MKPAGTLAAALTLLLAGASGVLAQSAPCGGDFGAFLQGVRADAAAAGISEAAIREATTGIRPDQKVLQRDRAQGVFQQAWITFADRMVNKDRLSRGRTELKRNASLFAQIEAQTGVPGPVITAFWGLETDFGGFLGDFNTLNALATLAHDCRRPELFRPHLLSAIRLVDLGYLSPDQMRGAWAGELGQTQLLPEDYISFGTDGDGNGRVDLLHDKADVLVTTGKFIQSLGWQANQPWIEEVRVPRDFPFDRAALANKEPRRNFAELGITKADGSALEADALPAALVLPQGRGGPAFLTFPNFDVYVEWNNSLVYTLSAAYFATRLSGAPAVNQGKPRPGLGGEEMKILQQRLAARGHDVGKVDGILGAGTRAAVREEQIRLGMPADGWPTAEVLSALD